MKINNEEISIEKLVESINPRENLMKYCGNDIYLFNRKVLLESIREQRENKSNSVY